MIKKVRRHSLTLFFLLFCLSARSQTDRESEAFRYIEENKIDSVEYFLKQGNDINGIYPRNTLLEIAIVYHKIGIVNLLIKNKANVNLQTTGPPHFYSVSFMVIGIIRMK